MLRNLQSHCVQRAVTVLIHLNVDFTVGRVVIIDRGALRQLLSKTRVVQHNPVALTHCRLANQNTAAQQVLGVVQ